MRTKQTPRTLTQTTRELLAEADEICELDPEMCEAAAMVYIGDIYSLRDDVSLVETDDKDKSSWLAAVGFED